MILSLGRRWAAASADRAHSTLRTCACRRLGLEGVGWTAARTEVLLDESPHDPAAPLPQPRRGGQIRMAPG